MISLLKLSKRILILSIFVSSSSLVLSEPKDIWKQSQEITIKENQNKKIENSENNLNKDLPQTTFDKEKLNQTGFTLNIQPKGTSKPPGTIEWE